MKKSILLLAIGLTLSLPTFAQKYFTREGQIRFTASTALESIDATSKGATAVIDAGTGAIEFAVLVKGFIFEKALMQEHFNENYMESDKFPKATFKGMIQDAASIKWGKDGDYPVKVKGKLTMHGVERDVTSDARIIVKGGKITASSTFEVAIADYRIEIPSVVADKIAKTAKITVTAGLAELKK